MNIDIKNSLDSLLVICNTIKTSSKNIGDIDRMMIQKKEYLFLKLYI